MTTSNNSSRPAYSRVYNLTPSGSALAQYLDYLNSRPVLDMQMDWSCLDLPFHDLPDPVQPEHHDDDREQPLPKFPATFDDQAWSEEYPDDFYESGLPDSDDPVDDGYSSDDGED